MSLPTISAAPEDAESQAQDARRQWKCDVAWPETPVAPIPILGRITRSSLRGDRKVMRRHHGHFHPQGKSREGVGQQTEVKGQISWWPLIQLGAL